MKNANNHVLLMWSAVLLDVLFQEPWFVFDVQTHFRFMCRSVSYYSVLKDLLQREREIH